MKSWFKQWASLSLALLFASVIPLGAADNSGKDSKSTASAGQQYQALVKEHQTLQQAYFQAIQKATTDEERQKVSQTYPQPEKFTRRFLELAARHPDDAAAIDSLVWVVQQARQGPDVEKALEILLEKHAESDKVGPVCQSLVYSPSGAAEKFLAAVVAKNPHRRVQGQALFSSGQQLMNRTELVRLLKQQVPVDHLEAMERRYGKENLKKLRETKPEALMEQAEKFFEQVAEKYADLPHYRGSLGDGAKTALFELRHLSIGHVAPEVEGEDIDGKKFKLSDYRGKVVVIDFWGDW